MLAVGFQIPPGRSVIGIECQGTGMHVADDALTGWDRPRELMLDRMAWFVFGDRRVTAVTETIVPEFRIWPGMKWVAIVRVNDMTGGASAGTIITRLIVRAQKREHRIE